MDSNLSATVNRDTFLDNFGAELADAAYPVMLRHAAAGSWLDLELELWKVLRETVKKWDQEWPSAGVLQVASDDPLTASVLARH